MYTTMHKSCSFLMFITCLCMLGSKEQRNQRKSTNHSHCKAKQQFSTIRKASGLEKQLSIVYKIQLTILTKGYNNY